MIAAGAASVLPAAPVKAQDGPWHASAPSGLPSGAVDCHFE
eukprot:COSAG06_NODE_56418_length_284_cov_9.329730_2_plen_40_part_01